jgi:hypothetical protein
MRATKINSVVRLFTLLSLTAAGTISGAYAMEPGNAAGPKSRQNSDSVQYTFERNTFDVSRQHGHVYFNNYWYSHPLIEQHQYVRLIEVFDHQNFTSDHEFFNWAKTLRGTRTYTYDTVKEHRPNSVTNLGPLVLLAAKQRAEIDPAWRFWRDQEETRLAKLAQKQREAEAIKARQDAELETSRKLVKSATQSAQALSVLSGNTSLWEVELQPRGPRTIWLPSGSPQFSFSNRTPFGAINFSVGGSKYVRSYGRNSVSAGRTALTKNPNYRLGSVRRVSGF